MKSGDNMEFTHFNSEGLPKMVDVGDKEETERVAIAYGKITAKKETINLIRDGKIKKGDVLSVAQVAGIMAAKKTSDIIPMTHNIFLTSVDMTFNYGEDFIEVYSKVKTTSSTGVEIEALNSVTTALLTIYDMAKAVDRAMVIEDVKLIKKTGGKSGVFLRKIKGKVVSVNISETKGVVKVPIDKGEFIEGFGLKDDAHAGKWHRQVSLLGVESIDKMKREGLDDLQLGDFAENITTSGILLYELPIGTKLKVGECELEVTQIGKKCHEGCAIKNKVGDCVMPREGIFARVLKGGVIKAGDDIEIM
jgi:cyclic pyranopterin phosphate synthase